MATKTTTVEAFDKLHRLDSADRQAVEDRLAASADDAPDLEAIIAEVIAGRDERLRAVRAQEVETVGDDLPTWTLAGREARPLSAGVVRVLEMVEHPLAVGGELTLGDMAALLYVLTAPDRRELVRLARDPAAFREEVDVWAFDVTPAAIEQAFGEATARMATDGGDDDEPADPTTPPTG